METEVRLRSPPVASPTPMEAAEDAAWFQEGAGGDDLDPQRIRRLAVDFAEVGRLPGPNQRFQATILRGTEDLQLKIPTASRTNGVIGGATLGRCAWVGVVDHWQSSPRKGFRSQLTAGEPTPLDVLEPSFTKLTAHSPMIDRRDFTLESMSGTTNPRAFFRGVATGDREGGPGVEVGTMPVEGSETDPIGVAEEPSAFMVGRIRPRLERRDPEGHGECQTLATNPTAGWGRGRRGAHAGR